MGEQGCVDVAIVGGGASGLAAAYAAAQAGATVVVLERDVALGLSILKTGNGRCNISNARLDFTHYLYPERAAQIMGEDAEKRLAQFFDELGIVTTELEGRLYPASRSSASVRDALILSCEQQGVQFLGACELNAAELRQGRWELRYSVPVSHISLNQGVRRARRVLAEAKRHTVSIHASALILATGGASTQICEQFGLAHLDERPVLCPLACELAQPQGLYLASLDGIRIHAKLTLVRAGRELYSETGEVLFRSYGISGIVSFNCSRRAQAGDILQLNLMPSFTDEELEAYVSHRQDIRGLFVEADEHWFDGLFVPELGKLLYDYAAHDIRRVKAAIQALPLTVFGTAEEQQAQVRRGGIPLGSVDERLSAGEALFAAGELLDMDADCGGYNLAWAWLTGILAGKSAAHYVGATHD
ncbi:NAD(P)/FAD-dependent oxidoreductase [Collinsella sp. zg1085]|uniref:FAD-dependent oxidoreductase n=1 Tax=Collinsella sp. zg1085 TaxID=2844380 RepID=UPI001C0E12DB|nr:FAD-dependent oxidoreductase [Collinsella sp. zg1085]QWT17232.1 NAD(P)/FAD-dependent oxidoreductase [Collinsella sp. zg1085]